MGCVDLLIDLVMFCNFGDVKLSIYEQNQQITPSAAKIRRLKISMGLYVFHTVATE